MKTISINVSEPVYREFQRIAKAQDRTASELIRQAMEEFLAWMRGHGLGRKRLLDTLLATTYYGRGITTIATSNARDYRTLGVFDLIVI